MIESILPLNQTEPRIETLPAEGPRTFKNLEDFEAYLKKEEKKLGTGSMLALFPFFQNALNNIPLFSDMNSRSSVSNLEKSMEKSSSQISKEEGSYSSRTDLQQKKLTETEAAKLTDENNLNRDLFKKLIESYVLTVNIMETFPQYFKFMGSKISSSNLGMVIDEIVKNIKLLKTESKSQLQLDLLPKELGKMLLSISEEKGVLNISIVAAENIKKELQAHLAELQAALAAANLKIGDITVSINPNFNQQNYGSNDNEANGPAEEISASENSLPGAKNDIESKNQYVKFFFSRQSFIYLET